MLRNCLLIASISATLVSAVGCGDDAGCPDDFVGMGSSCEPIEDAGPMADGDTTTDGGEDAGPGDQGPPPCEPTGEADVPEAEFEDANCDGYDGDLEVAVAVVPAGAAAPEGIAASESTLSAALATAETEGLTQVWVPVGEWAEAIELVPGISIYGGYDAEAEWQRTRESATRMTGPGPLLIGEAIDVDTEVALIDFVADDATAGESSIAARVVSSTALRMEEVRLEAGRGGDGTDATRPAPAGAGTRGGDGGMTGVGTQCSTTYRPRQAGAAGGAGCSSCYSGGKGGTTSGADSSVGTVQAGRSGGDGSTLTVGGNVSCSLGGDPPNGGSAPGGNGLPGQVGAAGDEGDAAGAGVFTITGFVPGDGGSGTTGSTGQGGGGGGSAADVRASGNDFCIYFGASGGGGGGGGCGGLGGEGGTGGGASVALFLWDATVTLVDVTLASDDGGDGGRGALGGEGGVGGDGGAGGAGGSGLQYPSPAAAIQDGGDGGRGGNGGLGGGGGGGAGGPSVGILLGGDSAEAPESTGVVVEVGSGGAAGPGSSSANDGLRGEALERLDPEA